VHNSSQSLCQSTFLLLFIQLMHNAMRKLQVWNRLLVTCLNTPPRPTWGHSMHFYDQAPFNQITQQGCQSTGLELRIPNMYYYLIRESGPVKLWRPPPKFPDPPLDPLIIDSFIYQSIALDVRIPNIYLHFD
jgi:hypothetical protein